MPRSRVLKDEVLIEVALAAPRRERRSAICAPSRAAWSARGRRRDPGGDRHGLARDPNTLPKIQRERRNGGNRRDRRIAQSVAASSERRKRRRQQDDRHRRRARSDRADDKADVPTLERLAAEIVRRQCARTQARRLALTVENGKVVTLEWKDAEAPPTAD